MRVEMAARGLRRWGATVLLFALLGGPAWGQHEAPTLGERVLAAARAADEPLTIMVIRVRYAKAAELADTLRPILPPGVTLVPDPPTNSLILSGPPRAPARPIVRE